MPGMNVVVAVGFLGKDPESKRLQDGSQVVNFTIAISEKRTDKNGNKVENTEWIPIVVFGKQADFCAQYLKKGSLVGVEGNFRTRSWEDKKTNSKVYKSEVVARDIRLLSSPKNQQQQDAFQQQGGTATYTQGRQQQQQAPAQNNQLNEYGDNLPF